MGVELEQVLSGLGELAQAVRAFSDLTSGLEKSDTVKYRGYEN